MSDKMSDTGYDESFWSDVDALRAMLEEDDRQTEAPQAPAMQSACSDAREPRRQPAVPDLQLNFQNPQGQSFDFQEDRFYESASRDAMGKASVHGAKRSRGPARAPKGLLITLYTIIVLELAAIGGIGAVWYLWMQ